MQDKKEQLIPDISRPEFYNNRELSWLAFNERVMQEAIDFENPLLERMKFLAIFSSNLDEFFMVRVAGLKDQEKAGFNLPENKAGMTPKQQLNSISAKCHTLVERQYAIFNEYVQGELKEEEIEFLKLNELTGEQFRFLEQKFDEQIFPVLTPLAIDAYRPFPMLLNKSLNLAVLLQYKKKERKNPFFAIVQVPAVLPRFIEVPNQDGKRQFVFLEDLISSFIYKLFLGYNIISVSPFRITRNADLTIDEEGARDLLEVIEKELKKRKWGAAVRLEIQKGTIDERVLNYLMDVLEIQKMDVYEVDGPIDLTFLFPFYTHLLTDFEHLVHDSFIPPPPLDLPNGNLFEAILKRDLLLHHPYESFQPVVEFIESAADDPQVLAIKQTLYRVSGNSPIVQALAKAAENGKQVTVLVELKARFDEENNIHWAKMLEQHGVHVIYGFHHLKTHSKITLVVRQEEGTGKIQRFVHLSTGNYNDVTAKLYTDIGFFTSEETFGIDATNFFNYLSGYAEKPDWNHFSVSPYDMRETFIKLINQEIEWHQKSGKGRIIAKMNSLTDKTIIMKLYEASQAGVKIDLIVRGICCLRPQIKGVSENIQVRSIVGRFLEHSRIFYFHHFGEEKIFLSSADWMTRNMIKRVEILFPIYDVRLKERLKNILDIQLKDNVKARFQDANGDYHYVERSENEPVINSQKIFYEEVVRYHDAD